MNSLKMKMAVIFGVAQMSLGIVLKGTNAIHNKNMIDFLFEFCPQIIILVALFGYMDFMIIIKWLTNWEGKEQYAPSVTTWESLPLPQTCLSYRLGTNRPSSNLLF
jgi:V-type H+-transporting ATPase subunit a